MNQVIGLAFVKEHNTGNPDKDYSRTELGKFTNHSDIPNMKPRVQGAEIYFVATRDISPDEELTVNYRKFGWEGKRDFITQQE